MINLLLPISGPITQQWSELHPAIDIACVEGSPIVAAHSGRGDSFYSYEMGNVFVLKGENGLITSYSHLLSTNKKGVYNRGDVIGYCGSTGRLSTGPHLHFESNQKYQF